MTVFGSLRSKEERGERRSASRGAERASATSAAGQKPRRFAPHFNSSRRRPGSGRRRALRFFPFLVFLGAKRPPNSAHIATRAANPPKPPIDARPSPASSSAISRSAKRSASRRRSSRSTRRPKPPSTPNRSPKPWSAAAPKASPSQPELKRTDPNKGPLKPAGLFFCPTTYGASQRRRLTPPATVIPDTRKAREPEPRGCKASACRPWLPALRCAPAGMTARREQSGGQR